jgi:fructokinase
MSTGAAAEKPLICLGEALVDLICPEPVADHAAARSFEVHCGGALANVAVAARRAGAPVALASACGDDDRGRLLRDDLAAAGVDLRFYGEVPGVPTAFAFAYLDHGGEPTFEIHGAGIDAAIASLAGREGEIAAAGAAIVFGSNTLVDERSRDVTAAICERARGLGVPLLFDPNLRPGRWPDAEAARRRCLPYVRDSNVLKCNLGEARWLLAEEQVTATAAAESLLDLGPELVVVTAGTAPAVARGACTAAAQPPAVEVVSPLGAGDAFMGTLAAKLHAAGFDLTRADEALAAAVEQGARACTHLGAFPR